MFGQRQTAHGIKWEECLELGLACLVLAQVMQRESHTEGINLVNLPAVECAHVKPQPMQLGVAYQRCCHCSPDNDADTHAEASWGRSWQLAVEAGLCQANEKPAGWVAGTEYPKAVLAG